MDLGIKVAEETITSKGWSRKLSPAQLEALKRAKPKLSTHTSFSVVDAGLVELEIVPTDAPLSKQSQKVMDKKRMRASLAPKLKKASIDVLNAQLDFRIGLQKKANESMRGFQRGANDEEDEGDEPDYRDFREAPAVRRVDAEEEEEGMGSETSEEEENVLSGGDGELGPLWGSEAPKIK